MEQTVSHVQGVTPLQHSCAYLCASVHAHMLISVYVYTLHNQSFTVFVLNVRDNFVLTEHRLFVMTWVGQFS